MGDFADMALSETMDIEDMRFDYRMGGMSDRVAFELGVIDHEGFYDYRPMFRASPRALACKHCGLQGLLWRKLDSGQWRLHMGTEAHTCAAYVR